jgi:hypothetical protein
VQVLFSCEYHYRPQFFTSSSHFSIFIISYNSFIIIISSVLDTNSDSILSGQLTALYLSSSKLRNLPHSSIENGRHHLICDVEIRTFRSDRLLHKHINGETNPWLENVCAATVAVINYGAHAKDVNGFVRDLVNAVDALDQACGDRIRDPDMPPRLLFRTTPEGNPWCNTRASEHQSLADMRTWSNHTWRVLSGEFPPPDPNLYRMRWHWDYFQNYNRIAASLMRNKLGAEVLDVVPMTRLRPSLDWGQRPGNEVDCLHGIVAVHIKPFAFFLSACYLTTVLVMHIDASTIYVAGNAAVHEWNTLLLNALAADLCADRSTMPWLAPKSSTLNHVPEQVTGGGHTKANRAVRINVLREATLTEEKELL